MVIFKSRLSVFDVHRVAFLNKHKLSLKITYW
jgi:hypothetical protein